MHGLDHTRRLARSAEHRMSGHSMLLLIAPTEVISLKELVRHALKNGSEIDKRADCSYMREKKSDIDEPERFKRS